MKLKWQNSNKDQIAESKIGFFGRGFLGDGIWGSELALRKQYDIDPGGDEIHEHAV